MIQGSTPIQLSQLDISPAIQAGALEQQAAVNLAGSINEAVKDFTDKQEEKKQKKMTIAALEELVPGMSKQFYTAAAGNKDLQSSLIDAQVARQKAEDQRITQGAYYLSQFPQEQRKDIAEELGLPLPPEPEVLPFDIEGFETRITGAGNEKLAEQLEAIKQNPDNPQNATALELLGMPADVIPSYLESLKAERTAALAGSGDGETKDDDTKMTKEEEEQFLEQAKPSAVVGEAAKGIVKDSSSIVAEDPIRGIQSFLNPNFLRGGFGK
jgi:hypothetical protein